MSETKVTVELELLDKAIQKALGDFVKRSENADKIVQKLGKSGSDSFDQIAVHIGKATGLFDIFAGNLAANLATKAFDVMSAGASALFDTFITKGVQAAAEQEQANRDLNIALANTGIYSRQTALDMQNLANEIQATTGVEDNLIIKNAALIQNLGQLDKEGLQRATKASVDLAAALDKDLGVASEALAKAATGNLIPIKKMGLTFEEGGSKAETFKNILDAVESRFAGTAAAKVNTYSGAISLVSANFGELQETIGFVFTENEALVEVIKQVGNMFGNLNGDVQNNTRAYKELVAEGLILVIRSVALMSTSFDAVARVGKSAFSVVEATVWGLGAAFTGVMSLFDESWDASFKDMSKKADDAIGAVYKSFTEDTALGEITTKLFELGGAAERGLSKLERGATSAKEPINNVKKATTELTDEQKKYNEELDKWIEKMSGANATASDLANARLEDIKYERDQKIITDDEYFQYRKDVETARYDAEEARAVEADKNNIGKAENRAATHINIEKNRANAFAKIKKEEEAAETALNKAKVQASKETFGNLASLMQTTSKELFEIGKAAALAQAAINTYQAITMTMASVPFPFNIPLAVAQGIAGAVQIANIANTQPKFEQGGIVGGSSFSGDKVGVRVNSGEMILNRGQQGELFKLANGGAGGDVGAKLDRAIGLLSSILSQPLSVNVDGRELFRVLRDGTNAGRTFA